MDWPRIVCWDRCLVLGSGSVSRSFGQEQPLWLGPVFKLSIEDGGSLYTIHYIGHRIVLLGTVGIGLGFVVQSQYFVSETVSGTLP